MKHTIRQNGQLTQINCELGSGVLDKNGREIIEGDIIHEGYSDRVVVFRNGYFILIREEDLPNWRTCGGTAFNMFLFPQWTVVVGHVEIPS